jgi:hypothetical protein
MPEEGCTRKMEADVVVYTDTCCWTPKLKAVTGVAHTNAETVDNDNKKSNGKKK